MKNANEKITALRAILDEQGLDGFIIPKADAYQGEFVPPAAERLKWLTGFTGSAGAAVVLKDKACVLTDGRYTIQIVQEIDGAVFETADSTKLGVHGWLNDYACEGALIGYDAWLHTPAQIQKITDSAENITLKPVSQNPIDQIWTDRPEEPCGQVELFPDAIAGQSFIEKKTQIAATIAEAGATAAIITLPDSISWLLNIRGADIDCTPSALSYAIIYADDFQPLRWIINPQKLTEAVTNHFGADIEIIAPADIAATLKSLQSPVMLDFSRSPTWFKTALEGQGVEVTNQKDPCIAPKAIKTPLDLCGLLKQV